MKKKWLKKGSAALLAAVMGLSLFPAMEGTLTVQAAGGAPEAAYWTDDKADLQGRNLTGGTKGSIIFGKNSDSNAQTWKIAGTDSGISGENVILFAASPLLTYNLVFEDDKDTEKDYDYGEGPVKVYPNHYGSSDLRDTLSRSMDLFTTDEQNKMNATTISTYDDKNTHSYTVEDFLYAPSGGLGNDVISVGSRDDVQIPIGEWGGSVFWLRSPSSNGSDDALVAIPGDFVP